MDMLFRLVMDGMVGLYIYGKERSIAGVWERSTGYTYFWIRFDLLVWFGVGRK
jgi:hypothetical protein